MGTSFSARPDRPWGPPNLLYNGYRVFPEGRRGRGEGLTPHPHLECRGPRKSIAIPLLTLRACVAYKKDEHLKRSSSGASSSSSSLINLCSARQSYQLTYLIVRVKVNSRITPCQNVLSPKNFLICMYLRLVRGSNPGGSEIFCTRPDRHWGPTSILCSR